MPTVELDMIIEEIDEDHTGRVTFERKNTNDDDDDYVDHSDDDDYVDHSDDDDDDYDFDNE